MGEALVQSQHLDTDTIVVRVRGELDIYTAPALRQILIDHIERDAPRHLVVDLGRLMFMDSTGIGSLVAGYGAAKQAGTTFTVHDASPFVHQQLRVTGLADLFGCNEAAQP